LATEGAVMNSLVDRNQKKTNDSAAPKGRTKQIGPPAAPKMLVMTNKTPFWNEQSQVYQVKIKIELLKNGKY
jgi:hypothetical protein